MAEITGVINSVSQSGSGFKIGDDWFNYSNRVAIANKPVRGQRVTVTYDEQPGPDGGGPRWIAAVTILDNGTIAQRIGGGGRPPRSPEETRSIIRQSVLRSAAIFCAGVAGGQVVPSTDVLKIAEAWIEWVERKDG